MIITLIALPFVQMQWHIFPEKPLNGAFVLAENPDFSRQRWESGEYQLQVETFLKDHAGFRNFMIRLYNQLDYSLYRRANAEGAIIGEQGQLFEYDYIRSWLATDFPGESFISKKLNRAKFVQDYLKREKGIDLVIVFEPGKASFYPEHIPEKYIKLKKGPSTYDNYLNKASEVGLEYTDWQAYFMQLKPHSQYPLFPRYGTHWSVYGMKFAADSMIRLIEGRRGIDLADVVVKKIETSRLPRDTDDDVAKTMNLLFRPKGEELAYPILSFDTAGYFDKPMVLVVADSYYWNIFNTRIPRNLFANEAFWYFNALVYPDYYLRPLRTEDLDLRSEIEKQDIIFLMITERFLHKFDWTFTDQLYGLYTPDHLQDPVYDYINKIMKHGPWYADVIEKARINGISLEEALVLDAKYVYHLDDTASFMIRYGPWYYSRMISNDPAWMRSIREKAVSQGITEQQMLEKDALYLFQKNFPDYYDINRGIDKMQAGLRTDLTRLDSIRKVAGFYRFDEEELLWITAREIYVQGEVRRISDIIRQDKKWLEDVKKKALDRNIPLDSMVQIDAAYILDQKLK